MSMMRCTYVRWCSRACNVAQISFTYLSFDYCANSCLFIILYLLLLLVFLALHPSCFVDIIDLLCPVSFSVFFHLFINLNHFHFCLVFSSEIFRFIRAILFLCRPTDSELKINSLWYSVNSVVAMEASGIWSQIQSRSLHKFRVCFNCFNKNRNGLLWQ